MATKRFDKRMHIMVSADELAMLQALADREGFTPSDMVRQLVRRAYREGFGEAEPKKPTTKTKRKK